jgi:uncharacterized protein YraI
VINVTGDDRLNIRTGPGYNFNILGKIPKDGRRIQVSGDGVRADNTVWFPITYEGITGWVDSYYLAPE